MVLKGNKSNKKYLKFEGKKKTFKVLTLSFKLYITKSNTKGTTYSCFEMVTFFT